MSAVSVALHRVTGVTAEVHRVGGCAWVTLTFESDGADSLDVTLFCNAPEALLAMLTPTVADAAGAAA